MMLMEEAERIARDEHGSHKLAVISGEARNNIIHPLLTRPNQISISDRNQRFDD